MFDMLGRQEAIDVFEAFKVIDKLPVILPEIQTVDIEDSYEFVLAVDVFSPVDLPHFNRSTMDGFAVRADDTYGASETMPAYLKLLDDEILIGQAPTMTVNKGEAVKIPTGAMLPKGADSVVMFENTNTIDSAMLEVMKDAACFENVIKTGEDCKKGELIFSKGQKLRAQDVGTLGGIGITQIQVYKKPTVAIISTGDEIVSPTDDVGACKVRDINSYTITGLISTCGGVPVKFGIIKDNYDTLKTVIDEAIKTHSMVLISGGSSVGTKDMTKQIIDELGQPDGVIFHGVNVSPGKPLIAGCIDNTPVFGLPGHPAAVVVSFSTFIKKVLLKLTGVKLKHFTPYVKAILKKSVASRSGRQDYIRVRLEQEGDTTYALPILGKSGLITTLTKADGMISIPPHVRGIPGSHVVDVFIFQ